MDSTEQNGLLQDMGNQKISVPDQNHYHHHHHQTQMSSFKYETSVKKSDSYVVDLESFSNGCIDHKDPTIHSSSPTTTNANSRITLQRSMSRKVPQRGAEKKIIDRDPLAPSSSPRATQVVSTSEKSLSSPHTTLLLMGSTDQSLNNHHLAQHQITIKTSAVSTLADGKLGKRPSFRRTPAAWFRDPKRILLVFATLSSMGTILLIYFTLAMSKQNENEGGLDWQ